MNRSWPEAEPFTPEGPQPLLRTLPAGRPYPVAALGALGAAVSAVQAKTGAPLAIPAQSALAVASLAVQAFADVESLGGVVPLSLYALTIAESGARKSSCDRELMAGLREHEREQATAYRAEIAAYQNRHALWKVQREAVLREGGKTKGEMKVATEADLRALGSEPNPPPSKDRIVTEPTFEGLTRLFATGQPSLGIFSDEGGQFLGGYGMGQDNRQKTMAALNDLWGGNPVRRTRAGDGSTTLVGRRLALHLMVQPVIARTFMADSLASGSGFLPRFLICEPASTIGLRLSSTLRDDPGPIEAFGGRLRVLLGQAMPLADPETRELRPRSIPLAREALARLVHFSDDVERRQAPGGDLAQVTGYASKAAEQAARIAGVLTLWPDLQAPRVEAEEMAWAIDLADHYLSEALRLADAATISAETVRAEVLRCWLVETWPHEDITSGEILQFGPNSIREAVKVHAATDFLARFGWLEPLAEGTTVRGKPRKKAWRVVRP